MEKVYKEDQLKSKKLKKKIELLHQINSEMMIIDYF